MPIHDWTRVEAGIFHDFHHEWISEIKRALNRGILPENYYALAEQHAVGLGPDVLTLQGSGLEADDDEDARPTQASGGSLLLTAPKIQPIAETDMEFYRRKQNTVAVRHVSGDRIVAMIEIVSPGNKASRNPLRAFVGKVAELLDKGIHLLILDVLPPGKRDPQGIHGAIWQELDKQSYTAPADKPLTQASYECGEKIRAYVIHAAVGDALADLPLFLERGLSVSVPLEATYQAAWAAVPRRWQRVLERQLS